MAPEDVSTDHGTCETYFEQPKRNQSDRGLLEACTEIFTMNIINIIA